MAHFSKYIRPSAKVITTTKPNNKKFMVTAAKNPDGSIAVVLFNEEKSAKEYSLTLGDETIPLHIDGQAIQTVVIPK